VTKEKAVGHMEEISMLHLEGAKVLTKCATVWRVGGLAGWLSASQTLQLYALVYIPCHDL